MDTSVNTLAVVGGGAAGLAAAVAAGERARELGVPLEVVVYERDERVGRSILVTGNGRCNFSNEHPYVDFYRNDDFVESVFHNLLFAFDEYATDRGYKMLCAHGDVVHAFFYQHGLTWRTDADGRQYPRTNKASTVLDVLRASAANVGVREACGREVRAIEPPLGEGKPFTLRMADGVLERAQAVVMACGGRALGGIDVCGLEPRALSPVLGPLRVAQRDVPTVRELDNIRVRCTVSLVRALNSGAKASRAVLAGDVPGVGEGERLVAKEEGELLFRKYGVSGICVFNLSRHAKPGDSLRVNLLDGMRLCDARDYLFGRRKALAGKYASLTCEDMLRGLFLPRVAEAVLAQTGLKPSQPFAKADVPALAQACIALSFDVEGMGDADICQAVRGGFDVDAFDARTLAFRDHAGLYAAGEALDVDGPCGGFNLHWAWASGLLAGRSAASALCQPQAEA